MDNVHSPASEKIILKNPQISFFRTIKSFRSVKNEQDIIFLFKTKLPVKTMTITNEKRSGYDANPGRFMLQHETINSSMWWPINASKFPVHARATLAAPGQKNTSRISMALVSWSSSNAFVSAETPEVQINLRPVKSNTVLPGRSDVEMGHTNSLHVIKNKSYCTFFLK